MAGKRPDIASVLEAQLQGRPAPPAERDIETITEKILEAQRVGGEQVLIIGKGLLEVKTRLNRFLALSSL